MGEGAGREGGREMGEGGGREGGRGTQVIHIWTH